MKMNVLRKVRLPRTLTIDSYLRNIHRNLLCIEASQYLMRCLCKESSDDTSSSTVKSSNQDSTTSFTSLGRYEVFRDEQSPVILDIQEERFKALQQDIEPVNEYVGLNLERGIEGIYDIEDIVELLRREKARNIFVAKLPKEFKYVDYIVVVTGKSARHMKALAEFVRKVYKKKRHAEDPIPKIEGENSRDWIAMDLGNIAVHIFSEEARHVYDLESLWSVGADFDELSQQPEDPLLELLKKHSIYLGDLQPASTRQ